MILFYSECRPEYGTYTFPYAVYCVAERREELPEIYARGFLPYSGDPSLRQEVFYLARSVRVELARFEETSENRRVARKAEPLGLSFEPAPKAEFDTADPAFRAFCLRFAEERFHGGALGEERLAYLLSRETLTHIFTVRSRGAALGYLFAAWVGPMLHYWFAFYDTAYRESHALGKWMMWRALRWAQAQGLEHVYLGSCYTPRALYKVRDHRGIAFFDGVGWNRNVELLKRLAERDVEPPPQPLRDLLKPPRDVVGRSIFAGLLEPEPGAAE